MCSAPRWRLVICTMAVLIQGLLHRPRCGSSEPTPWEAGWMSFLSTVKRWLGWHGELRVGSSNPSCTASDWQPNRMTLFPFPASRSCDQSSDFALLTLQVISKQEVACCDVTKGPKHTANQRSYPYFFMLTTPAMNCVVDRPLVSSDQFHLSNQTSVSDRHGARQAGHDGRHFYRSKT